MNKPVLFENWNYETAVSMQRPKFSDIFFDLYGFFHSFFSKTVKTFRKKVLKIGNFDLKNPQVDHKYFELNML